MIALFAVAVLLGGMIFFAAVMAPLIFTRLRDGQAGPFIRQVFPVYYLFVLINAALATICLLPRWGAAVMGLVTVLTLWLRQWLMPRINGWSDAMQAGDTGAKRRFDLGHRVSVVANLGQMLIAGWMVSRLG